MTSPDAVDQSWGGINPAYAASHGVRTVWDYLSHDPTKDWTAAQIKAYHAAGVGCGFLFETSQKRALDGQAAGLADGQSAAAELTALETAVGYKPASELSIIAAIDFDTNPTMYTTIRGYIQGFRNGLAGRYLTGAYGEADILDALGALVDVGFQTYAWSGGRLSPRAALYQYLNGQTIGGATVDFDRIIDDSALGAWWPAGHEPSGGGTQLGGFLMALSDADQAEMLADVRALFARLAKFDLMSYAVQNNIGPAVADIRTNADMVPGLVQAVGKLPTGTAAPLDVNAVVAALKPAIDAAVKAALDQLNVTSTVITTLTEAS